MHNTRFSRKLALLEKIHIRKNRVHTFLTPNFQNCEKTCHFVYPYLCFLCIFCKAHSLGNWHLVAISVQLFHTFLRFDVKFCHFLQFFTICKNDHFLKKSTIFDKKRKFLDFQKVKKNMQFQKTWKNVVFVKNTID